MDNVRHFILGICIEISELENISELQDSISAGFLRVFRALAGFTLGTNLDFRDSVFQALDHRLFKKQMFDSDALTKQISRSSNDRLKTMLMQHGLNQKARLDLEEIIRSCYKNPTRKSYPGLMETRGFSGYITREDVDETPEYWIGRLIPELRRTLYQQAVMFPTVLTDWCKEKKINYLPVIFKTRRMRWYGPYYDTNSRESISFVTATETEAFEVSKCFFKLNLDFSSEESQTMRFSFFVGTREAKFLGCTHLTKPIDHNQNN